MFSKNLKYYRLKKNMTRKKLALLIGVTPMAVSYYENGERRPDMETVKALASALDVKVSDFLNTRNENLEFEHAEFRKGCRLSKGQQEYIREDVEEYMGRFYSVLNILGGEVLPDPPDVHRLTVSNDVEHDAGALRKALDMPSSGPVGNLIELLENRGILVYASDFSSEAFSGMNGLVNERPYVVYNKNMSPERIRSTIVHELAHIVFVRPSAADDKEIERYMTSLSGAFLFPKADAERELGIRRSKISKDMSYVAKEYGISMHLLVKRAAICGIINAHVEKDFYIKAADSGWKIREPSRIEAESPFLFDMLVFRAVCEDEISVQKGAELLKRPYEYVAEHCFA